MKAISILQPWASLVVHGHKRIETRSWNTKYRGELLIHASKSEYEFRNFPYEFNERVVGFLNKYTLPYGAIIGKVNLDHVIESDKVSLGECFRYGSSKKWSFTEQEISFGDYSPNRFGWLLSDPIVFDEPIPCKGQLGIWNFDTRSLLNSGISHVQFTHDQDPSIEEVLAINAMYEKAKYIKV